MRPVPVAGESLLHGTPQVIADQWLPRAGGRITASSPQPATSCGSSEALVAPTLAGERGGVQPGDDDVAMSEWVTRGEARGHVGEYGWKHAEERATMSDQQDARACVSPFRQDSNRVF